MNKLDPKMFETAWARGFEDNVQKPISPIPVKFMAGPRGQEQPAFELLCLKTTADTLKPDYAVGPVVHEGRAAVRVYAPQKKPHLLRNMYTSQGHPSEQLAHLHPNAERKFRKSVEEHIRKHFSQNGGVPKELRDPVPTGIDAWRLVTLTRENPGQGGGYMPIWTIYKIDPDKTRQRGKGRNALSVIDRRKGGLVVDQVLRFDPPFECTPAASWFEQLFEDIGVFLGREEPVPCGPLIAHRYRLWISCPTAGAFNAITMVEEQQRREAMAAAQTPQAEIGTQEALDASGELEELIEEESDYARACAEQEASLAAQIYEIEPGEEAVVDDEPTYPDWAPPEDVEDVEETVEEHPLPAGHTELTVDQVLNLCSESRGEKLLGWHEEFSPTGGRFTMNADQTAVYANYQGEFKMAFEIEAESDAMAADMERQQQPSTGEVMEMAGEEQQQPAEAKEAAEA